MRTEATCSFSDGSRSEGGWNTRSPGFLTRALHDTRRSQESPWTCLGRGAAANESGPPRAKQARITERKATMRAMFEITSEGDLVDDGEIYALFSFDPEALGIDPIE